VTAAIAAFRPKYVSLLTTVQERRSITNRFNAVSGLGGVIGAVDCTHVPIQSPGGDDAEIYRYRKGYFSINVQLVCDFGQWSYMAGHVVNPSTKFEDPTAISS